MAKLDLHIVLKDVTAPDHLRCWLLFVKATSILCSRTVSIDDTNAADQYLVLFCKEFEKLYGPRCCTPNMHLHLHLRDCVLDYGPVYSFWCFAFERYNGMLGFYPTNSRQIEPQMMRKFIQQQQIHSTEIPQECASLSQALRNNNGWTGSLLQSSTSTGNALHLCTFSQCNNVIGLCDFRFSNDSNIEIIPPVKEYVMTCDQLENLHVISICRTITFK